MVMSWALEEVKPMLFVICGIVNFMPYWGMLFDQ